MSIPENQEFVGETFKPRRSRAYYERKLALYSGLVSLAYGISIDATTRERWTEVAMFGRAADTFLDTKPVNDGAERSESFEHIVSSEALATAYPSLSEEALGPELYRQFIKLTTAITETSTKNKETLNIRRHLALRAVEGFKIADMVILLTTQETAEQPRFKRFAHHFRYMGAWSTLGNSTIDFYQDVKKGEIALPYSVKDHFYMARVQAGRAIHYTRRMFDRNDSRA